MRVFPRSIEGRGYTAESKRDNWEIIEAKSAAVTFFRQRVVSRKTIVVFFSLVVSPPYLFPFSSLPPYGHCAVRSLRAVLLQLAVSSSLLLLAVSLLLLHRLTRSLSFCTATIVPFFIPFFLRLSLPLFPALSIAPVLALPWLLILYAFERKKTKTVMLESAVASRGCKNRRNAPNTSRPCTMYFIQLLVPDP